MMNSVAGQATGRKQLLRWMGWFGMANAALLAVVGLRYFTNFTPGGTILSWIYMVLIYPAHHILLALGPVSVLLTPLVILKPSRNVLTIAGVVLFALMIAVIMLDSLLWSQSRFHINALTLQILGWQSWVFVAVIFLIGLFFESMLAGWVWRWVDSRPNMGGRLLGWVCVFTVIGSQFIHAWADASYYVPVTSVGQQLPVYKGFTAKRQLSRLGLVNPEQSREREMARRLLRQLDDVAGQVLDYPIKPLQCRSEKALNLVLIIADAMRSDMLGETTSPGLLAYARRRGQAFTQHFSGGNSSRMGVFSLFYSLPPGYWSSFESLQRSSVLIDELQRQDYQLGLFSSATMYRPVMLDRTAFSRVPDLRIQTKPADYPSWKRDRIMTEEWFRWVENRDHERPFFGFLFYDATSSQTYPDELKHFGPLEPLDDNHMSTRFSNYRKSVYFVDGLIRELLDHLDGLGLLDSTVVVITSDHGEEFDESGTGMSGHGSGYTEYQLKVPMIVLWPGNEPRIHHHRTSHYDVVPTLMQDVLGCMNPASDYASGRNLFSGEDWEWLLAGSYYNYAVLEPDQITVTYPNGSYEVRDWSYHISQSPQIRGEILEAVTRENSRFYR